MADNTVLNPGAGGDTVRTEDVGGGIKIPAYKIHTGNASIDGGPVTATNPLPTMISDGAGGGTKTSVGAFHNTDNQTLPGAGGSLLTGGVPQITNPTGTADRARGTGIDGISAVGVTVGAAQFAQKFKTTITGAITSNAAAQAVTPVLMTGIQVGSIVVIDVGSNQEIVFVTAVTASTFSAIFTKNHVINTGITGFVYNQERDAKGELDGADGTGTAVAAEYEYNGGSPGGGFFDRARNLQGKGVGSSTLNGSTLVGAISLLLNAVVGLQPGQPLYFNAAGSGAATTVQETAYVDINYVSGSLTVPLQSGLANAHTNGDTVRWDTYAAAGPGLNGFYATGIGIEEEALYDPVSGQFFLERSATQDAVSAQNVVLEAPGLWNGATIDRGRDQSSANTTTMLTPSPISGVELTSPPAGWAKFNSPAAATMATTTIAAGAAGVRHICTSITVTVACGATPQTPITASLRDGATLAGPVLWSGALAAPANSAAVITATGLAIPGSTATAMTLEFGVAGVAASLETVAMTGYDIS